MAMKISKVGNNYRMLQWITMKKSGKRSEKLNLKQDCVFMKYKSKARTVAR